MVILRILLPFLLLTASLFGENIRVAVDLDPGPFLENQPIKGTVSITHGENEAIDANSFKLGSESLQVEPEREVQLGGTPPTLLTIFRFRSAGQKPGLYVLPAVSVSVNGNIYKSSMTSYEVQGVGRSGGTVAAPPAPAPAARTMQVGGITPSIKLEAYIEGKSTILPGERTRLAYRIIYSGDIELREEVLPMLKPDGLRKIGDLDTQELQRSNASELIISQLVEGLNPGTFTYGPSYVVGMPYLEDQSGRKTYLSPPLRSEAPPMTVTVAPFPSHEKPASFKGAIGPLSMDVTLQSPSTVNVGDKITLAITMTGDVILENVAPPDVCCQPGFSGFFKTGDLPPQSNLKGNTKTFLFDLWPLTPEVKAIPPLEYAYFDPKTGGYIVLKSKAIPLQVLPAIKPAVNKEEEVSKTRPPASEEPIKTKPIEIQGITPLSCKDLHNLWLGGWDLFALVPIGIALLLMQMAWRDALEEKRKRIPIRTSKDLLREAEGCLNQPKQFFPLLNRALIVWLKEQGAIERSDLFPESLPDTGVAATVKAFLMRIQELRFTGQEDLPLRELLKQAEEIMGTHPKEEGETL